MRPTLILLAAVLLLVAQAAVVGVGLFHAQVSSQYRAVFIERSATDWVRETTLVPPL